MFFDGAAEIGAITDVSGYQTSPNGAKETYNVTTWRWVALSNNIGHVEKAGKRGTVVGRVRQRGWPQKQKTLKNKQYRDPTAIQHCVMEPQDRITPYEQV